MVVVNVSILKDLAGPRSCPASLAKYPGLLYTITNISPRGIGMGALGLIGGGRGVGITIGD
jgi:hypothetical protein